MTYWIEINIAHKGVNPAWVSLDGNAEVRSTWVTCQQVSDVFFGLEVEARIMSTDEAGVFKEIGRRMVK